VRRLIGRFYLWLFGWRWEGEAPKLDKYVMIAAPHTSNWDLPAMLAFTWINRMHPVYWVGKQSLFKFPLGPVMRLLGGLSVDRSGAKNQVEQLAEEFSKREKMILAIPPEGTRGHRDYWRSGFYFIAKTAGVPIALTFLDYGQKRGGCSMTLTPGDDVVADMDRIREFFSDKVGRYPENMSTIRLRAEEPVSD